MKTDVTDEIFFAGIDDGIFLAGILTGLLLAATIMLFATTMRPQPVAAPIARPLVTL